MSGALASIGHAIDPLCGPVGAFTLLAGDGLLTCGDTGWGDEIAFGVLVTASLAVVTFPIVLVLGFLLALAKRAEDKYLSLAMNIYTTIFRGLPELLTLFIIYYGFQILIQNSLSVLGYEQRVEVNSFVAGMIALSLMSSAFCSEVFQSALQAIPKGQYEAGAALGFRKGKTTLLIIIPQLLRVALPGLGNIWMVLLKDTALVSIIALPDIMRQAGIAARVTKEPFLFFGLACLLYLALAMLSSIVYSRAERWAKKAETR